MTFEGHPPFFYQEEVTRIPNIGQLTPGYQAVFIVLDQDILEISINKIDEVHVGEIYIGGHK